MATRRPRSVLRGGDFVKVVLENWETEFLQMGLYVVLTASSTRGVRRSLNIPRRSTPTMPVRRGPGTVQTLPGQSGVQAWRPRSTRTP